MWKIESTRNARYAVWILSLLAALALLALACGNQATSTPTSQPAATATPTSPAPALTLRISEPKDGTLVTDSLLKVAGQTAPDAVVSVNGTMVKSIDANGYFATVVTLVEGPNLVEVIASDYQNNQQSQTLAVIYTP